MKKLFVLLAVLAIVGLVSTPVFAFGDVDQECVGDSCNDNSVKDNSKTTIKDNNVLLGGGNTGIQGNKNHHNTIVGGTDNSGNNRGNDYSTDINKNHHNDYSKTGIFDNKFKNSLNDNQTGLVNQKGADNQQGLINTKGHHNQTGLANQAGHHNTQVIGGTSGGEGGDGGDAQAQQQKQKQNQAQLQGQQQKTDIKIEGDTYEASKMHIQGPGLIKSDAKLSNGKRFEGRSFGSVWDKVDYLTKSQAKLLGSDAGDVEIDDAVFVEKGFVTKTVNKGKAGQFLGLIYVYPEGKKSNHAGMEGKAADRAMEKGATHMHRIYDKSGDVAEGDSWNIGLGGGASIITTGDSVAIAPNGGMGFGSATASNARLPEMVFELYCDEAMLNKEELSGTSRPDTDVDRYQATLR